MSQLTARIPYGSVAAREDVVGASLPVARHTVLRFGTTERLLHWAIAIPFLGCMASALVLVIVYNPDPTRAFRPVFAWMHRASAVGLLVCPTLVLLGSVRHWPVFFYNIRQAWGWRLDDVKWLALMGPAAVSKRIVLPDQGKFNAAEKLNFMMVTIFPFLFAATGLLMWFPDLSKLGSFAPWIVHCALAAMAMPLIFGHMFMATVNPSTREGLKGMISGHVDATWAAHHYAHWFREHFPHLTHIHFPHLPHLHGLREHIPHPSHPHGSERGSETSETVQASPDAGCEINPRPE